MNKRAILNTRPFLAFLLPALMVGCSLMPAARVTAQTFTSLYQFTGGSDGAEPFAVVLSGITLYGTAQFGGSSGNGTVFAFNTNGTGITILHGFTVNAANSSGVQTNSDGSSPGDGLVLSGNTLYGTANSGGSSGNGTVFAVNPTSPSFTNLHSFTATPPYPNLTNSDGANPQCGLIVSGNTLFGTAANGGSPGKGTVFKVNTDGTVFTNLHTFTGSSDGANPYAGLVLLGNTLYGTAVGGGSAGNGTVFRINTDGTVFTNLHSFTAATYNSSIGATTNSDGANPQGGLILAGNILYGTAANGGSSGKGTVFAVNTDGTGFTNLHSFVSGSDGANPACGLVLSGNTLYGTAPNGGTGYGTVFGMNADGTGFTNLHSFTFSDGANPYAGLILSGNKLYGAAYNGGRYGNGTLFSFSLGSGVGVTITVPPQSLVTNAGATVSFSITATGTGQLSYQWLFNGTTIPGATDVTLSLTNVQLASAGDYWAVVTNSISSATSAAAQLILLQQTNRQATVAEIGQSGVDANSQLQVYTNTNGAFQSGLPLNTNRMTIVLTHGWNSAPTNWPAQMAALFVIGGRTPAPNIVAWDWQNDAASDLLHIYRPVSKIPAQGDALGRALLAQLGPNYSQPIHFIGHSFGTLVNARAADYLHGDGPYPPAKGANAFLPANTQMTLFDEAELAPDSINAVLTATVAMITGVPVPVNLFYGSAMPKQSRWADNYVSAVGLLHPDAANVIFMNGLPGLEPDFSAWSKAVTAFHGYPCGWYGLTVPVGSASWMGDQWSFEQSGFASAPATNSVFLQTAGVSPMDLTPTDMQTADMVLLSRFADEAVSLGIAATASMGEPVVQVYGQVLGSVGADLSSLYMLLQTRPGGGLLGPNGLPPIFPKGGGGGGGTNAPACAWIPLAVPSNAVSMSFDFMLQGDGQDDSFAVAVNGTNVLSLAMSLIQTNVTMSSGLIGVSPWAGQTVELFLGIVGGTSTSASLTAGGISFYAVVPPSLQAQASGSNLVVTWPVSADGYALETSTSLTGTNSWAPVTNVPPIVYSQYTVTNALSAGSRFYRLKRTP